MTENSAPTQRRLFLQYLLFLIICIFALRLGWVIPDGAGFGAYLPTLYLDGDLNFFNQYIHCGIIDRNFIHGSAVTSNGYPLNLWTIGTAVLWTPFWLLGHALTWVTGFFGQRWTPNGFTLYYNFSVHFATAVFGFCTLFLIAGIARKYVDAKSAAATTALITIGTPFYWYLFHLADAAHVPAAFVIALFVVVFLAYRSQQRNRTTGFLLGLLGGLATIIKPNNVLIFLFPVVLWAAESSSKKPTILLREASWMIFGAILTISIQFFVWQILFGNPLGPILDKGVQHYYKFFTGHFWLLDVLFSSYHGMFFFSPILILAFAGLWNLLKTDRTLALASLIILILQILLMANERYFWQGTAFGLRRLVDWTPLFALGVAVAYQNILRGWFKSLAFVATAWTLMLYWTYSGRPASVLLFYQSPRQIFSWMSETIRNLPQIWLHFFDLAAPPALFFPPLLICGLLGYVLFLFTRKMESHCLRAAESPNPAAGRSIKFGIAGIALILVATYGALFRAWINGEPSKRQYHREIALLAQKQHAILAYEETEFLLHEAKYLSVTRSFEKGRASFLEALKTSPNKEATAAQIRMFVNGHLPRVDALQYLQSMNL